MIQNNHFVTLLSKLDSNNHIQDYLFVHYGKMDQEIAIATIQLIEKKLILENFERNIITKTKTICIEIIQNIIKHQKTHETIFPYFVIGSAGKEITIYAGNVITNEKMETISQSINTFQTIEKDQLKKKYLDKLRESAISPEGNAGMGLMDIVYRSEQHLDYEMKSIDGNLYSYDLKVELNKKEKVTA